MSGIHLLSPQYVGGFPFFFWMFGLFLEPHLYIQLFLFLFSFQGKAGLLQTCWCGIRKVFFALQVQKFFLVYSSVRWQVWKELLKGCLCRSKVWKSESRKKKGYILHFYCRDQPGSLLKMYILSIVCFCGNQPCCTFCTSYCECFSIFKTRNIEN